MRHPQGGGLTAERQAFRERVRMEAAVMFAEGRGSTDIAKELRVSVRSVVLGAWIVFEDEAGFSMTPPTSRTWSQRGTAPVIRVRGRSQRRFSIATHQQLDAPWSVLRRTTQANTAVTDPSRLIHRLRHGLRQINTAATPSTDASPEQGSHRRHHDYNVSNGPRNTRDLWELRGPLELKVRGASPGTAPIRTGQFWVRLYPCSQYSTAWTRHSSLSASRATIASGLSQASYSSTALCTPVRTAGWALAI
ncbi:hypothetical protein ACWGOK_33940 [Streptomyces eurythermus]